MSPARDPHGPTLAADGGLGRDLVGPSAAEPGPVLSLLPVACDASLTSDGRVMVGMAPTRGAKDRKCVDATDLFGASASPTSDAAEWCGVQLAIARRLSKPATEIWTDSESCVRYIADLLASPDPCAGAGQEGHVPEALARLVRRILLTQPVTVRWVSRTHSRLKVAHRLAREQFLRGLQPITVWRFLATSPAWDTPEMLPALAHRFGVARGQVPLLRARMLSAGMPAARRVPDGTAAGS